MKAEDTIIHMLEWLYLKQICNIVLAKIWINRHSLTFVVGMHNARTTSENWQFLPKLSIHLLCDLALLLLGYLFKRNESICPCVKLYANIYNRYSQDIQNLEKIQMPSTNKYINQLCYIHSTMYKKP